MFYKHGSETRFWQFGLPEGTTILYVSDSCYKSSKTEVYKWEIKKSG